MKDLLNSVAAWTWVADTGFGPMAFLLVAHPERLEGRRLEGLADAMGLGSPKVRLRDTGERVTLFGCTNAAVHLDGCDHLMQVSVGDHWSRLVADGGPVALLVGLDPLPRRAPRERVEPYLAATALADRLRMGLARIRP